VLCRICVGFICIALAFHLKSSQVAKSSISLATYHYYEYLQISFCATYMRLPFLQFSVKSEAVF
jgi:hypothetical protein